MTSGPARPPGWDEYWQALAAGDAREAAKVVLVLQDQGTPLLDILEQIVAPAQVAVGRLWADNEWNVAQEHRATSVSEEVIAALALRSSPSSPRGVGVVTCVDGEWHSLPARLVATALGAAGWRVHYLGASVPVHHFAQLLQDLGPDFTGLSCSVPTALRRARGMIEASREAGIPVLVGGPGFGPGGRWGRSLGATAVAATAREALEMLSSPDWPRYVAPAPPLRHPDSSAAELGRLRTRVVAGAFGRLKSSWPGSARYDEYQLARTEEDIGYLVDFLGASLYVDDPDLYRRFIAWMGGVLQARGVPLPALQVGIAMVSEAVAEELPGVDRPQHYLKAGLDVAGRSGPLGSADPG